MIHTNSLRALFCIVLIAIGLACNVASASPLSQERASILAKSYVDAQFDRRHLTYQVAVEKLKLIHAFDTELMKARPSASLTYTHPIWKAARANLLSRLSPSLELMFSQDQLYKAHQTAMTELLSDTEAEDLLAFISSTEGALYFQAVRLTDAHKSIEKYILLVATNRSLLPELISGLTVQTDLRQVSEESNKVPKPDKETERKIRAFGENDAWKNLQRVTPAASRQSLKQLSSSGQLDGVQGAVHLIVGQAVEEFKKSQATQTQ